MATERIRKSRNVTLDTDIVKSAKKSALNLVPPEKNLSRIIDKALSEFAAKYGSKGKQ